MPGGNALPHKASTHYCGAIQELSESRTDEERIGKGQILRDPRLTDDKVHSDTVISAPLTTWETNAKSVRSTVVLH